MPVPAQTPTISYTASGSASFTYPFLIPNAASLKVYVNDLLQTSGYTVSGVGVTTGGSVVFSTAPDAGAIVKLERYVPRKRDTDYTEGGALRANTLDADFDNIVMMLQETLIVPDSLDTRLDAIEGAIYINPTNQNIGLSTTTTPVKLNVNGAAQASSFSMNATGGSASTGMTAPASSTLALFTNTVEALRITPTQSVLIGKQTSLGYKLDVQGQIGWGNGTILAGTGDGMFTTGTMGLGTTSNHALTLGTNATARVTVDASGNVGLGTTGPGYPLHLFRSGNATHRIESTSAAAQLDLTSGSQTFSVGTNAAGTFYVYNSASGASTITSSGSANSTTTLHASGTGILAFNTATVERMRVDANGNVGVGTSAPTNYAGSGYKSIALNGTAGGILEFKTGDVQQARITGWSNTLAVHTNNTERLRVDSSGNVSINTTAAAQGVLQINGDIVLGSGAGERGNKLWLYKLSTTNGAYLSSDTSGDVTLFAGTTAIAEKARFTATGRLGIGTTAPTVSLEVNATDAIRVPVGTAVQRPTAATGQVRYNTDSGLFEGYTSAGWSNLGVSSGATAAQGLRNKLINGDFRFWQRATTQSDASSTYGSDDRWINTAYLTTRVHSQQVFTVGQTTVSDNPVFYSRTVVSSVADSNSYAYKSQRIEDVRALAGKTVTVSFWAKADAARPIAIELYQHFGTGGSASVSGIGAQKFTLSTSWQKFTATVALPSISGKTVGSTSGYTGLFFWFDSGTVSAARTASLGQQSGTFDIANVQLEEGASATSFEARPVALELALCQRYCYVSNVGVSTYCASGFQTAQFLTHPVPMRVTPTLTVSNVAYSAASSLALDSPSINAYRAYVTATGAGAVMATFTVLADAEL